MRKIFTLIIFFVIATTYAQAPPEKISYRAVAMNGSTVLANTTIGVKINILQTSALGASVFEQVFKYKTDGNGQYSFFIGDTTINDPVLGPIMSTTINSGTIFGVSWSDYEHFLKVSIDPAGGTSYVLVGTTQLTSVPYALYAKSAKSIDPANGGYEIAKNIQDLVANVERKPNKLVYVKGYYTEGDGGGGFFLFNSTSAFASNLGTIFKSTNGGYPSTSPGRWLRQYEGYMDVRYFGVLRDWDMPTFAPYSNSDRIQDMIDYTSKYANVYATDHKTQNDLTIFFPSGWYMIDKKLYLKDRVHISGGNEVRLVVKDANVYDYMFELAPGPAAHLLIENLNIQCTAKNTGGFHLKPVYEEGKPNGLVGLWDSTFRNINIEDASNPGIYLEGPDYVPVGKNFELEKNKWLQTLLFDNIRIMRWDNKNEPALKLTGYNANYTFTNCEFTNSQHKSGDKDMFIDGACVTIGSNNAENEPKQGSYAISFINCGMGVYARYGAVIDNSSSITFDTGFYEGLDIAFVVRNSKQVKIVNNRFANASGMGSYCANATYDNVAFTKRSHLNYAGGEFGAIVWAENSIVSVQNNNCDISSSTTAEINKQYFTVGIGNKNVFDMNTNSFGNHEQAKTLVLYHVATISADAIDTTNQKVVFVTTTEETFQDLKVIKSDLSTGEYLVIRANTGGVNFISMNDTSNSITGSNIFLPPGMNSLQIDNGHTATFVRIEDTFQLISTY